ncbi:MAG: transporter [Chlamydiae bacterium RIFCSPHIGHO2_12_FULL_44_59]|nr:MAG: transporter [Chlamydiae bacterium RIFCSPHIGHO2_01_FULL_44_39]OGN58548.1 MAG: transporter [Chlamydiae bacterium RIFCSPHIGHO2_02_FULL_45_9]OGN59778.1 MAG: transporter [Chlamydiae bacterium RIFCSPHIGHO2_12_FULL_44_59]OGN65876.1 MAG: transporter [Chlamydiae bacterium RIFCSPLOWO2_01_FULL_44_52]OGN68286.1 MAG: transporter [Chlamydiae bacterium RIFCSPLOWO2_02_FULL_45_22]OGN69596.1 MAG: transporter [Chlamydiae bacterium RIFCSPLOWO2_12_FULL_45_20]
MGKKIRLLTLVFLIVAAIDSIRNLPATAIFGPSLIFFFLFSAIVFLFPISLIAAEFSSRYPEEGGVFHWVRNALGETWAVVAIWLQWVNTMVWYPTILSFIAGTAAYLINPEWAQKKEFILSVVLIVFWGLTFLNMRGIYVSAFLNTVCACVGLIIPMGMLMALGALWVLVGNPIQITFSLDTVFPTLKASQNWVSLIAIMAAFLGMELAGVHVTDILEPQKNFPKALGWSVFALLFTMILGALSIAIVIPQSQIHLIDGMMQTFTLFFQAFHIPWFVPILTIFIIIGSIGGMINWLVSPARGLLHAAERGFMPQFFAKKNRSGVPVRMLLVQAFLVTLFCLMILFMPSINAFYWFLTALSTELYMIMYILLFISALKLGRPHTAFSYQIPKGLRRLSCVFGLFGCLLTIVVGFFLPSDINMNGLRYALYIGIGNVVLIAPVFSLMKYKKLFSS